MRIAIVTGGASGIGKALAEALVARGDWVAVADIDGVGAKATAERLRPGRAKGFTVDVCDPDAVANLVCAVRAEHGRLDLIFNNAGIAIGGAVEELTLDHWNRAIDVNLRGVIHGVRAAYPLMIEQGHGHIVNTASLAGLVAAPLMAPYTATKHAVVGLSLALRAEAAAHGVRVSAVCPGFVDTPLLDHANPDLPETAASRAARPLALRIQRRLYAPEKLARHVLVGLARNKPLIVAPFLGRMVWRGVRFTPWAAHRITRRIAADVRRRAES